MWDIAIKNLTVSLIKNTACYLPYEYAKMCLCADHIMKMREMKEKQQTTESEPCIPLDNAAFEREESDVGFGSNLQVVGIDDRNLNGGGGIGAPRVKLTGPNVCTQQEP